MFFVLLKLYEFIFVTDWLWTDGTLFDFKPWMSGEPDNWNKIEHCVRFRASDRTFSDVHCSFKLPFICKVQKGTSKSFIKINYFHVFMFILMREFI